MSKIKTPIEIEPCPFCKGRAYIDIAFGIPFINANHTKKCLIKPNTWLIANRSLRKQIKAWNMRE